MKKITALMLIVSLMMLPGLALAQVTTQRQTLSDIGISMDIPTGWYTATPATAGNCTLATAFDMTEAEMKAMLQGMGASFYAVCDDFGIAQMVVISGVGYSFVDMRDNDLDMDAFMRGFLTNYSNVKDSGVYQTKAATFAYVRFTQQDTDGSEMDIIQFVTNVNGKIYVVQMMSLYGIPLSDATISLTKAVVDSITFR